MSKFSEFVTEKKIHPSRVLAASEHLEKLRPEDRAIRLARRNKGEKKEGEAAAEKVKPRSGRPITPRAVSAALAGKSLTGPQKTRLLRAVNRILEQRKQEAVDLRALF
ncbi:MAG TPA: hypothetical protein VFS00_11000 [Polyangiaceae bacterium]|nr:hypothetical protein [Polyangiaceae bacterium]